LAGISEDYDYIQYNEFKSPGDRRLRDEEDVDNLFLDRKTNTFLNSENDCQILVDTGVLTLPPNPSESYVAKILDLGLNEEMSTSGSFVDSRSSPAQLLTGKPWLTNIGFYFLPSSEVVYALEVVLGGMPKLNYLRLFPAILDTPIKISSIYYGDLAGNLALWTPVDSSMLDTPLYGPVDIGMPDAHAAKLIIVFSQTTYQIQSTHVNAQYAFPSGGAGHVLAGNNVLATEGILTGQTGYSKPGGTGTASFRVAELPGDIMHVFPVMPQEETRVNIYQPTSVLPTMPDQPVDLFIYPFGLKSLEVGFRNYQETGIYVSKPLEVARPGRVALSISQMLPPALVGGLDRASNVETYIFKKDYNEAGETINRWSIPILPINTTSVVHERILPDQYGLAKLQLPALLFSDPETYNNDITIYCNGVALEAGEWSVFSYETTGHTTLRINGAVLAGRIVGLADIYTASYTPAFYFDRYSTLGSGTYTYDTITGDRKKFFLDAAQTIWFTQEGTVEFDPDGIDLQVATSDIYLILIIRQTTPNLSQTALIESYKLMAGSA
jgi:hypothetical protein